MPYVVNHQWDSMGVGMASAIGVSLFLESAVLGTAGLELMQEILSLGAYHGDNLPITMGLCTGTGALLGIFSARSSHQGHEILDTLWLRTPTERERLKTVLPLCRMDSLRTPQKINEIGLAPKLADTSAEIEKSLVLGGAGFGGVDAKTNSIVDSAVKLHSFGDLPYGSAVLLGVDSVAVYLNEKRFGSVWEQMYFTCQNQGRMQAVRANGEVIRIKEGESYQYRVFKRGAAGRMSYALQVDKERLPNCEQIEYWLMPQGTFKHWSMRKKKVLDQLFGDGIMVEFGIVGEKNVGLGRELGLRKLLGIGNLGMTYWAGLGLQYQDNESSTRNHYVAEHYGLSEKTWFPAISLMNHYVLGPIGFGLEYQLDPYAMWTSGWKENSGYFVHLSSSRMLYMLSIGLQRRLGYDSQSVGFGFNVGF